MTPKTEKPLSPGAERLREFLRKIYSTPFPEIVLDENGQARIVSRPPVENVDNLLEE